MKRCQPNLVVSGLLLRKATGSLAMLLVVAAILAISGSVVEACPTCKVALANHDEAQGDIVSGYFWSILFMMSMPFLIFSTLGGYMYWLVRRARASDALTQGTLA